MGTLVSVSAISVKGDNFSDFLFDLQRTDPLLKKDLH